MWPPIGFAQRALSGLSWVQQHWRTTSLRGAIRFVAIQGVVRRRPARGASRGDRGDHVPAGRVGHRERNRRALHPRIPTTKAWTVIAINCATLPDQLAESELFGSNAAP